MGGLGRGRNGSTSVPSRSTWRQSKGFAPAAASPHRTAFDFALKERRVFPLAPQWPAPKTVARQRRDAAMSGNEGDRFGGGKRIAIRVRGADQLPAVPT